MQPKRDNLVLIGAFAVAVALHASLLPALSAALKPRDLTQHVDAKLLVLGGPTHAFPGDRFSIHYAYGIDGDEEIFALPVMFDVFLSRDRVIDDGDQWMFEELTSLASGSSRNAVEGKLLVDQPIPESADGPYWLVARVRPLSVFVDTNRSNNTRVAPIFIDGPQRPELAVQTFNAPERASTGGSLLIDFSIDNVGEGWASSNPQLGEHGWADRVYLSTDDQIDPSDLPLRTFERTAPLGPSQGYRHEGVELDLPRGVSGPRYLILAADSDQLLDQPAFTQGFAARPIELIDTDEPDLVVPSIVSPNRLVIGRASPVAFTIANIGSVPTVNSGWVDGVYLSSDDQLDDSDLLVATVNAGQPLQPRSRYESAVEVTLPELVEPGSGFLIVKADADNAVNEAVFEDNNTFAVPIEVWTQEQADAQIKLGDPDRPERLVVQWIEHDRVEEHIARRSRTVQPAIQSRVDPDPNAPLVDNPTPPALASAESATGDPNRPTEPVDPTKTQTNQPPPDATATDVANRPQTESSPTQPRIDGLPGEDGTLLPNRDGADGLVTPKQPHDPTPGTQDKPSPTPGERDAPSPADPTAPGTDTTTDSPTPAETESDTDSKNPEKTDTEQQTEEQAPDSTTTPKPDTEDTPKPEGDDGDPATPSEDANPTRVPKDPAEAPPVDIKITELKLQEGRVLVGKGIKVTTKLPTPPGTGSRVLSIPRNARVSITFDNKGKVYKAKVIRSTTYKEWDAAIEASLYRWSARGEAIDKAKPHITIEWDYLMNDLLDEDE